jgi:two-component system response regulator DevR
MAKTRTFTEQDPIRVFLLDDHEVVRRGLSDLMDSEPDTSVVGDVEHALARGPALRPDVAVLDLCPTATGSPSAASCAARCRSWPFSC